MKTTWNSRMWGAATNAVGKHHASDLLHSLASEMYGKTSLKDLTDPQRQELTKACKSLNGRGDIDQIAPGYSTRSQRNAIAGARHKLNWPWDRIRNMVKEYGAHDWKWLRQGDADNLIQRLNQIVASYARKNA